MRGLIRKILTFWYGRIVYRKHAYNEECCCGDSLIKSRLDCGDVYYRCSSYFCPSRCQKEYAVSCAVSEKMSKIFKQPTKPA